MGVEPEAVRLVVTDDLERSRWTVFFRLVLAFPHLIVLGIWSLVSMLMAVINWFAILFSGRTVGGDLQVRYIRYLTQVDAYVSLAADKFPPWVGEPGYAVDVELTEQREQGRLKAAFRLVLAIPPILLASSYGSSGVQFGGSGFRLAFGLIATGALLGWFAILARGRMPQGLRDLIVYGLGYSAQTGAYLLLVTERYPNADPLAVDYPQAAPDHPVRIRSTDDLVRSRLTVFFRLLLWLPHLIWYLLWTIVVIFAAVANWFATLFTGTSPDGLHRFLASYVRYSTHNFAFIQLVANPFPGFTGVAGSYPVDVSIAPPAPQNRWYTGFRIVLAVPALLLSGAISNALGLIAIFGWFTGLIRAEMPAGLQRFGVFALRYTAQLSAYGLLLTDVYPFSGPSQELLPVPESPPVSQPVPTVA